jgi:hypothetical protein
MKKLLLFVSLVFIGLSNVLAQIPTDSLVGYWPFNGNAIDASGNGNNGTIYGAALCADRFGNANSAYSFNGVDNYIRVEDSPSLNINGHVSISMSAWVKTGKTGQIDHPIPM